MYSNKHRNISLRRIYQSACASCFSLIAGTIWSQDIPPFPDPDTGDLTEQPGYVSSEFIYTEAPFPSCHASTIEETDHGIVAAWFGGTDEKDPDVGIWVSHLSDCGEWSTPVEVVNGVQHAGLRYPTWNPVLFQPSEGPLILFYKSGPSPSTWWGEAVLSDDGGHTWGRPFRLPEDIYGPIKNKPIQLADGTILCGTSTEHDGWRVHMEMLKIDGDDWSWTRTDALHDGKTFGAIQPTVLTYADGRIQILNRSRQGVLTESWSKDGGNTWSAMQATQLPNPNAGADGVTLQDGRQALIYNHTRKGRSPLNLALSKDGVLWSAALTLENQPGEYSYPAIIQSKDGYLHITYTWKRERIKHVKVDLNQLKLTPMAR